MKIFFAVKSYWPKSGGVQSVTKYMAEGLVKKGHTVEVLTESMNGRQKVEEHNGVKIVRFDHKSIFKLNFGEKDKYQKYIIEQISKDDVLVTVCAQSFVSEWFFPIKNKVDAKTIMYMHGMRGEKIDFKKVHSLKSFLKEAILTKWWNIYFKKNWSTIMQYNACVHLFENDSSCYYFKEKGYTRNYAIANSCDDIFFTGNANSIILCKYKIKKPYFILVANYDENKNQKLALEAFFKSKIKDMDIVFIGSEENKFTDELGRQVSSSEKMKGCSVHIFTGIPREDVVALIKSSYASLLSSFSEYFPISLIEGMASGKPFISTAVGEVPKLIGGHVVHNSAEMSYWIKYFADNPDYVEMLGEKAKEFARLNMYLTDKIGEFERIIQQINNE